MIDMSPSMLMKMIGPNPYMTQLPMDRLNEMQGMLPPPQAPRAPAPPQTPPPGPSGLMGLLNKPGAGNALMAVGMSMMAQSDQPGSLLGAIGRSLPAGMQAMQQAQGQRQYSEMMQAATAGMSPAQRSQFEMMSPDDQSAFLREQMTTPLPREGKVVDGKIVDPVTGAIIFSGDEAELPTDARMVEWLMDQPTAVRDEYFDMLDKRRGPGVTINTGDNAAGAASNRLGAAAADSLISAGATAESADSALGTLSRMNELLAMPEARDIMGPGTTVRSFMQRFNDDPTAREIRAEYAALAGQNVLAGLSAFTGAISDKEREYVEKINSADMSLTVEELRSGIAAIERMKQMAIDDFTDKYESFDPSEFDVTRGQVRQYEDLYERLIGGRTLTPEQLEANFRGSRPGG